MDIPVFGNTLQIYNARHTKPFYFQVEALKKVRYARLAAKAAAQLVMFGDLFISPACFFEKISYLFSWQITCSVSQITSCNLAMSTRVHY